MRHGERLPIVLADSRLKEVVFEISQKGLGLAAVVDTSQALLGVVTDGDLRRVLDEDKDIRQLSASDIMSPNPKTIASNALAIDAVELMEKYKISGLLVVDEQQQVVGAFNMHDLFAAKLL